MGTAKCHKAEPSRHRLSVGCVKGEIADVSAVGSNPGHLHAGLLFAILYILRTKVNNPTTCRMGRKIADGEARERLIVWMRRRMEEFGITPEALAASIQHDLDHAPLYRDAKGNEWNGLGEMPDWLLAARRAGVSADFFRIEVKPVVQADARVNTTAMRQFDLFG